MVGVAVLLATLLAFVAYRHYMAIQTARLIVKSLVERHAGADQSLHSRHPGRPW
jgi:hypothetical protein